MKLLVTGGSGAVGRRLLPQLRSAGHETVSLTRGTAMSEHERSTAYTLDELREHCDGVDAIVHLAWGRTPSPRLDSWNANVTELDNLLEAALDTGVKRIIGASSISVYSGEDLPWTETGPAAPATAYGASKITAEHALRLARSKGISTLSLRLGHIYTDDEDNDYAVNVFIRKAEAGDAITVTGDANRRRDMVYVQDVSDAIRQSLERPGVTGTLNVGSGTNVTMSDIAKAAVDAFGDRSALDLNETPGSGALSTLMDITEATRRLDYRPRYSIHEGMRDIAQRRKNR